MRPSSILISAIVVTMLGSTAPCAFANDIDDCGRTDDSTQAIAACTRLIDGHKAPNEIRAIFYIYRGRSYRAKGDIDRAIADFDAAIKLDAKGTHFFTRGNAYSAKGDGARAIADYSEAIRLDPKDASAHYNRGERFRDRGDIDRAIADYDVAIALGATPRRLYARAESYRTKRDYGRAIADYSAAIKLSPDAGTLYFDRGRSYLFSSDAGAALADLTRANEIAPHVPYGALWREIAARRAHAPTSLAQSAKPLDMSRWPAPIIRLYLGDMTADAVLADAAKSDPDARDLHLCEARFYIAELSLLRDAKAEATDLFRRVVNECRRAVVEWESAKAELAALGVAP
jgi:lipoprotein NlpI